MSIFHRAPPPAPPVREVVVDTGTACLSGLLVEPAGDTPARALLVAVHGAGMHAGYFHCTTAPGLSLLELAGQLGFAVWAPDRPGVGASADLPDHALVLAAQIEALRTGIARVGAERAIEGGVVLVAHSYGMKVALATAAAGVPDLLCIDGAGAGLHFMPPTTRDVSGHHPAWGPRHLYPPGTFSRANLPLHDHPPAQEAEVSEWPAALTEFGPRIGVPVRFTFGEHEGWYRIDDAHFDALRAALPNARVAVDVESHAGHNISMGWVARAYHLRLLAFVEECLVARRFGSSDDDTLFATG